MLTGRLKHLIVAVCSMAATSCVLLNDDVHICAQEDGDYVLCEISVNQPKIKSSGDLYAPTTNFQSLAEYSEQMAYVLKQKLTKQELNKSIAVPPFLSLVPHYQQSTILTKDLPEFFIADLQNAGLPVAEYQLTPKINQESDYHDLYNDLQDSESFGYVLKGTVRPATNGVMLYVKIIDLQDKTVIASTAKQLPAYLVSSMNTGF